MSTADVLLVEDNHGDTVLLREAFAHVGLDHRLRRVCDGVEAVEALRAPGAAAPDLVILDLKLPRKDGREVLAEMRADPALSGILVVVLTSSKADRGLIESLGLPADRYMVKPVSFDGYVEIARRIARLLEGGSPPTQ